jgi:hypothetical protein
MIGCEKTKLQTSGIKISWVKLMLFGFSARNGFLAKSTFAKFEMAFWPEMAFRLL